MRMRIKCFLSNGAIKYSMEQNICPGTLHIIYFIMSQFPRETKQRTIYLSQNMFSSSFIMATILCNIFIDEITLKTLVSLSFSFLSLIFFNVVSALSNNAKFNTSNVLGYLVDIIISDIKLLCHCYHV